MDLHRRRSDGIFLMHLMVGLLSARYQGRGDSELAPYPRLVLEKDDGSVSIHGDKGFKPMNYMTGTVSKEVRQEEDGPLLWIYRNKKEILTIRFHEVFNEIRLQLGNEDPGHTAREGTEDQLQEWLFSSLSTLDPTLTPLEREHQTGGGPVDILAQRGRALVAVEVKRGAPMTTVGQVLRYMDALEEKHPGTPVEGVIAAVSFKDSTKELAQKKNVQCLEIPSSWNAEKVEVLPPSPPAWGEDSLFPQGPPPRKGSRRRG